jgi:methylamine dehydrogenase accessory protein MauD
MEAHHADRYGLPTRPPAVLALPDPARDCLLYSHRKGSPVMNLSDIAWTLPWVIVAFMCWLIYQLARQNGRILLRLDRLEGQAAALSLASRSAPQSATPQGLPIGSAAPDFELRDLDGNLRTLSEWKGKRILVIFFDPRCGFCAAMAPALAALPLDQSNYLVTVLITTGDLDENRQLVKRHDLRGPVLLQLHAEVAQRYQARGTPTGYLIDEDGIIRSPLVVGADALLAYATSAETVETGRTVAAAQSNGQRIYRGNRPLSESRIERKGLKAGTAAPPFRLPLLTGGEVALEDYRDRRVLLVFSDPNCGPCDQLLPELEQRWRQQPEPDILLVSRGEVEANRLKASQFGLTVPIALQRHWEISRLYGMFATPIAYLVNEEGIIIHDVAVGHDQILRLLIAEPDYSGLSR